MNLDRFVKQVGGFEPNYIKSHKKVPFLLLKGEPIRKMKEREPQTSNSRNIGVKDCKPHLIKQTNI